MSKPRLATRPNRRPEGDAESELRAHRRACDQCRHAGFAIGAMCALGKHLTNKLGLRRKEASE